VVGVRVGQEHLADRDGAGGNTKPAGERTDDRLFLAGDIRIDQDNPVAITDRPAGDDRRPQAPQPIGQFHEFQGQRGHLSSFGRPGARRNGSGDQSLPLRSVISYLLALTAAAVRDATPSFASKRSTWRRTVDCEITSASAI
jgi:hypothetical protein